MIAGDVGSSDAPLAALATDAGGSTELRGNVEADSIAFGDAVSVNGDQSLNAASSVEFGSTLDAANESGDSLEINSVGVEFNGNVGGSGLLDVLRVADGGVTTINSASVAADVVNLLNAIEIGTDSTVSGASVVTL